MSAPSALRTPPSALGWLLLVLPLAYLWFRLIDNLRVEWESNPQYSYGYIVPLLILGLILHRWQAARSGESPTSSPQLSAFQHFSVCFHVSAFQRLFSRICFLLFALLSFLYLPIRLVELATPEWRPIQWALGFITVGLALVSLAYVDLATSRTWLRRYAFPILFILVAIPWPTPIEQPIIQSLTRINSAMVIEVMGILGVPAVQHGNVIEVGSGVVGIDEACSGIRSFQSSLMISLFLGALYDLTIFRRMLFVPIGFLLAMVFNVGRTSFLTWIAAKKGVDAIEKYHDPAGLWILVGCTAGMWLIGMGMKGKAEMLKTEMLKSETGRQQLSQHFSISAFQHLFSRVSMSACQRLSLALIVWLVFVEIGSRAWYRSREAGLAKSPEWTLEFPKDNSTLHDLPIAKNTSALLRFDDGKQATWSEADGTQWSAFYFNWRPGRVAGYLAKRHTPEICMPATGRAMLSGPDLMVVEVNGLTLPVRCYVFGPADNPLHVFHCRWEAGATRDSFVAMDSARYNLIRAVWAGRGNQGQKVIEFIVSGTTDAEQVKKQLVYQLEKLIKVEGESSRKAEARDLKPET